jgi:hypothetical protein
MTLYTIYIYCESKAVNRTGKKNTMAKRKRTNNNLQNITQKMKDQATLKTRGELRCSGRVSSSCSTCSGNLL